MITLEEARHDDPELERRRLAINIRDTYNDYQKAIEAARKFSAELIETKIDLYC